MAAKTTTRHDLRTAATNLLWNKRSMMPEHSEEVVDDVLDAVLPLITRALDEMPSEWGHRGREGAIDWLEMQLGFGPRP